MEEERKYIFTSLPSDEALQAVRFETLRQPRSLRAVPRLDDNRAYSAAELATLKAV